MLNKIGPFFFLQLAGDPIPPAEQVELVSRPGVDGIGAWKTGLRGRPFTLRSYVDAENYASAKLLHLAYSLAIGSDPVNLIHRGFSTIEQGWVVLILDVRPVEIRPILHLSGGLYPPSLGWCACEWDLVGIVAQE